ncbi:MAG: S-layer homology domain-containing protein [Acutalibacter sp.]
MKSLGKRVFSAALACVLLVSATVSLNASAASASTMTDIPSGSWYESAVQYCLNNNYMNGESETKFNPNGTVSRAQMVQVLYNLEGQPGYTSSHTPFEDIAPGSWYYNAVRWNEENGIASGTSATTFEPNAPVTREQVATFFANYAKFKNNYSGTQSDLSKYSDQNKISAWAKENISWAVNYGLMSGTSETTLDPQGTCIRAQLAQFIKNYFKDDSGSEITPTPTPTPEPEDPDTKPVNGLAPEQKSTGGLVSEGKIEKTADDTIITFPVYNYGAGMQAYFDRDSVDLLPVPADGVVNEGENGYHAFPDEPNTVCAYYTDLGIIPAGGYVENGRIYTAQGFDVTSVDGVATAAEMAVLEDVNEYRSNAGIPELEWNEALQIYADERAIELGNQFDIYDSFVKPGLNNGQIPSSLENKLGETKWGHNIWIGGNSVSTNELETVDFHTLNTKYWLGVTGWWFENNYTGLFKHQTDEHAIDYNVGNGLINENATFGASMNADTNAADRWYTSLKGHKEIMMDRSKTCAAVGIARVDGVGSCVVLLVS